MVSKEELALVDRHLAAENEHRMDDTLATLHPACVFEDMAMPKVYRGREGAREYLHHLVDGVRYHGSRQEAASDDRGDHDRGDELRWLACRSVLRCTRVGAARRAQAGGGDWVSRRAHGRRAVLLRPRDAAQADRCRLGRCGRWVDRRGAWQWWAQPGSRAQSLSRCGRETVELTSHAMHRVRRSVARAAHPGRIGQGDGVDVAETPAVITHGRRQARPLLVLALRR